MCSEQIGYSHIPGKCIMKHRCDGVHWFKESHDSWVFARLHVKYLTTENFRKYLRTNTCLTFYTCTNHLILTLTTLFLWNKLFSNEDVSITTKHWPKTLMRQVCLTGLETASSYILKWENIEISEFKIQQVCHVSVNSQNALYWAFSPIAVSLFNCHYTRTQLVTFQAMKETIINQLKRSVGNLCSPENELNPCFV